MTQWFTAGTDVALLINYEVDGQFVVPNGVTFQLRDTSGTLVLSGTLPGVSTSEVLTLSTLYNALTPGVPFETRFVTVTFAVNGATHQRRLSYQLVTFLPLTATPAQVRAELGLDVAELSDSEIDVYSAYFSLIEVNDAAFVAAFTTGGVRGLSANQAVVVQAALNIASSLDLRAAVLSKSEAHQFQRKAALDFEAIIARLSRKLAQLLLSAQGITVSSSSSIFVLSTPTDVITG